MRCEEPHARAGSGHRPPGREAVAVCDRLRAVDKTRLTRADGVLSAPDLRAIEAGLRAVLEL